MEETAELPQLQLVVLVLGQGRSHARCVQRHLSGGSECSQLRRFRSCSALTVSWDFLRAPVHWYRAGGRVHRDTASHNKVHCAVISTETCPATQVSEPQPPQPPHSVAIWLKLKVQTGCRLFVLPFLEPSAVAMMSGERDAGSARRRRERRLRSWLRHERMTVAAELSAALHHSRDGEREQ